MCRTFTLGTPIYRWRLTPYRAPRIADSAEVSLFGMDPAIRKQFSATVKAQVVQELLKEGQSIAQLAAKNGVHPTQRGIWRATALKGLLSLLNAGVQISMNGEGRALDNIFVERLSSAVTYEEIYLRDYASPCGAREGLSAYFMFYNQERPHQALGYQTPAETYVATTAP